MSFSRQKTFFKKKINVQCHCITRPNHIVTNLGSHADSCHNTEIPRRHRHLQRCVPVRWDPRRLGYWPPSPARTTHRRGVSPSDTAGCPEQVVVDIWQEVPQRCDLLWVLQMPHSWAPCWRCYSDAGSDIVVQH
jgi:hypothetical protein